MRERTEGGRDGEHINNRPERAGWGSRLEQERGSLTEEVTSRGLPVTEATLSKVTAKTLRGT